MKSKLIFDGFEMTNADTMGGVTYKQSLNSGTDLQYGVAAMSEVSFAFRSANFDPGIVFEGQKFTLQMSQVESGDDDFQTVGIYTVYSVKKRSGKTSVTAYDNMLLLEKDATAFLKTVTFPMTMFSLLVSICSYCGVELSNSTVTNGEYSTTAKPSVSGATCRNLISYIAEVAGCYAFINGSGLLVLKSYASETVIDIDNTKYITHWIEEYSTSPIERVEIRAGSNDVTSDDSDSFDEKNTYLIDNNPIITAMSSDSRKNVCAQLMTDLADITYTPFKAEMFVDYGIQAGDIVTVDGVGSVVMEKTMRPGGVTIGSTGNKKREVYQSNEEQKQSQSALDALAALQTAEEAKSSLKEYAKKSEVSAEVNSYMNSDEGKASIKMIVQGSMSDYVKTTDLEAGVEAYIDTDAGTAQLVSAVSGTYATKDSLGNYVKTTELSSGITSYINTTTGKANLVSAVSGTYVTKDTYTKGIASIEQSVTNVNSAITLSSSYSNNTIGTNVYALLQLVSNANSSSITIKADKIDFAGFTTFVRPSDLAFTGKTTIDGGRITTGTISADRIDVDSLHVKIIYGSGTYATTALLYSDSNSLYLGGSSSTSSKVSSINMYATSNITIRGDNIYLVSNYGIDKSIEIYTSSTSGYIRPYTVYALTLGDSSHRWNCVYSKTVEIGVPASTGITIDEHGSITPSTASTSTGYYDIGTSSYPFNNLYAKTITGTTMKMGGSSSYYIQANSSRQLCPNTSSTSYPFYLGTSGYYWHYAYIGSNTASIGSSSSSKLGFFGTTPVKRQTVSSSATVATLITALKAYGLIL